MLCLIVVDNKKWLTLTRTSVWPSVVEGRAIRLHRNCDREAKLFELCEHRQSGAMEKHREKQPPPPPPSSLSSPIIKTHSPLYILRNSAASAILRHGGLLHPTLSIHFKSISIFWCGVGFRRRGSRFFHSRLETEPLSLLVAALWDASHRDFLGKSWSRFLDEML